MYEEQKVKLLSDAEFEAWIITTTQHKVRLKNHGDGSADPQDSIRVMQAKLGVYEQAVKWFRNVDEDELQRGIEQIRNIPKDVPLP